MSTYKKMKIEKDEDIYLKHNFCNKVDHSSIGRHTSICLEADRRLASSVAFHTAQSVVNDTLYREFQFNALVQISAVALAIMALGVFHNRYLKNNAPRDLPTHNKMVKID